MRTIKRCPKCGLELTAQQLSLSLTLEGVAANEPDWYYCPDCQEDFDVEMFDSINSCAKV